MAAKLKTPEQDEAARDQTADDAARQAAPNTAVAVPAETGFVMFGDQQVEIVRRVTIPFLPLDVDSKEAERNGREKITFIGRIIEAIYVGKPMEGAKFKSPAKIMTLEAPNGSQGRVVVPAVLEKELLAAYPDDTYVGNWFMLTKFRRKAEKNYNTFEIIEIKSPRTADHAA